MQVEIENKSSQEAVRTSVAIARSLPLEVNLAKIQNICYELLQTTYNDFLPKGEGGKTASAWIDYFRALAEKPSVLVAEEYRSLEPNLGGAMGQQVMG
ncbi:MAG TPA: hypothetical protein VEN79_04790 [Terriglobia bacterium]|nr:hypothetical protein [Terriglobia bacterium]